VAEKWPKKILNKSAFHGHQAIFRTKLVQIMAKIKQNEVISLICYNFSSSKRCVYKILSVLLEKIIPWSKTFAEFSTDSYMKFP
jgi:hypothetical protein